MTNILIVDTETTGLDSDAQVCELAATLYQIANANSESGAIASASTLLPFGGQNNAEPINHITEKLALNSQAISPKMIDMICYLANQADYAVAFGADFDKPYWQTIIASLPWVCAQTDFDWGYPNNRFSLHALALWLGIGVSTIHRAGDDVRLLVECFNRIDDLEGRFTRAIERAQSPWIYLRANVSYGDRELAKQARFSWDATSKKWLKKIKECDRENLVTELGFEVEIVDVKID